MELVQKITNFMGSAEKRVEDVPGLTRVLFTVRASGVAPARHSLPLGTEDGGSEFVPYGA
jgi:hypothetical protein